MTITPLEVYFILKLDAMHSLLVGVCFLGILFVFLTLVYMADIADYKKDSEIPPRLLVSPQKIWAYFKIGIFTVVVTALGGTFIPTTKEMATILILPAVANNTDIQKIPKEVIEILGIKLESIKDDLKQQLIEK